jgi:hypothetical protein
MDAVNVLITYEISRFHGTEYEDESFLGYRAV